MNWIGLDSDGEVSGEGRERERGGSAGRRRDGERILLEEGVEENKAVALPPPRAYSRKTAHATRWGSLIWASDFGPLRSTQHVVEWASASFLYPSRSLVGFFCFFFFLKGSVLFLFFIFNP